MVVKFTVPKSYPVNANGDVHDHICRGRPVDVEEVGSIEGLETNCKAM